MTSIDVERGFSSPEVYKERSILLKVGQTGVPLYGMVGYRAGKGKAPQLGDEMVLSVQDRGYSSLEWVDGQRRSVDHPPTLWVEGVFRITDVADNSIDSPFFTGPDEEYPIWGVTVDKIRDIETLEEIDRIEAVGILAII